MPVELVAAQPVLASLDIRRSVDFYRDKLGFKEVYCEPGTWGVVERNAVQIHFWACNDRAIAEATSCRVKVKDIEALHAQCQAHNILHPNAPLGQRPWGTNEFGVLDPDGNLITFFEPA